MIHSVHGVLMWEVKNFTPYLAERAWVRDRNGADTWIVVVKATFTITAEGALEVAEEQAPVELTPVYTGDAGKSSLLSESDVEYPKPGTDILLGGHAYAPRGEPCRSVEVTMKAGPIHKRLRVHGDRRWEWDLTGPVMSPAEPFIQVPLVYERAFGGVDVTDDGKVLGWERQNPVGTGYASIKSRLSGKLAPNIEYVDEPVTSDKRQMRPGGFGPIARDWTPRVQRAGTFDDAWMKSRMPLFPLDFDDRFFHCAPDDQQVPGYLRGGETVELTNLSANGYLSFQLPRATFRFTTFIGSATVEHRADLSTVLIEPAIPRVIVLWKTAVPCHGKDHKLRHTEIRAKRQIRTGGGRELVEVAE